MVRLRAEDFSQPEALAALARVIQLTPEQFRDRFGYLVGPEAASEPQPRVLDAAD
jgi:hypothetical protein